MTTNLILALVLSNCTEFASRLQLPVNLPLTRAEVSYFEIREFYPSLWVTLGVTNGCWFHYQNANVCRFRSPFTLHDRFPTTNHFGREATLTRDEALTFARERISKLGYSLGDLNMDLEPEVKALPSSLPYHEFTWYMPNFDRVHDPTPAVIVEVDAADKRILYLDLSSLLFSGSADPGIPGLAELKEADRRRQFARYAPDTPLDPPKVAESEIRDALGYVRSFSRALALPFAPPVSTDEVRHAGFSYQTGAPRLGVRLTNGMSFLCDMDRKRVEAFSNGSSFFSQSHVRLRDYVGENKMSENAALSLVRDAVRKVGYGPHDLLRQEPVVQKPNVQRGLNVPRTRFSWQQIKEGVLEQQVTAEVDLSTGQIVTLSIISGR